MTQNAAPDTQRDDCTLIERFVLVGYVQHPAIVEVEAETLQEALGKTAEGDFVVREEQANRLVFVWERGSTVTREPID